MPRLAPLLVALVLGCANEPTCDGDELDPRCPGDQVVFCPPTDPPFVELREPRCLSGVPYCCGFTTGCASAEYDESELSWPRCEPPPD